MGWESVWSMVSDKDDKKRIKITNVGVIGEDEEKIKRITNS